jgi:hypothetical protein
VSDGESEHVSGMLRLGPRPVPENTSATSPTSLANPAVCLGLRESDCNLGSREAEAARYDELIVEHDDQ